MWRENMSTACMAWITSNVSLQQISKLYLYSFLRKWEINVLLWEDYISQRKWFEDKVFHFNQDNLLSLLAPRNSNPALEWNDKNNEQ
jgi:hypothetical protein